MRLGIFVINLERDAVRLEHMDNRLKAIGLTYERFPAIHGHEVPQWLRKWFFTDNGEPVQSLTKGEVGVYASHLCVHKLLIERDLDAALVMEDDLVIDETLVTVLENLTKLPAGWDIVRLSNTAKAAYVHVGQLYPGVGIVAYTRIPINVAAYLVSRAGAVKTTTFRGLRRDPVDLDWRRPWDWGLNTYGIAPAPAMEGIFPSSIDSLGSRPPRKTRPVPSPTALYRQLRWQLKQLGFANYMACLRATWAWRVRRFFSPHVKNSPRENFLRVDDTRHG